MATPLLGKTPTRKRAESKRSYIREHVGIPTGLHAEIERILQIEGQWMDIGEFIRDALKEKVARSRVALTPAVIHDRGGRP